MMVRYMSLVALGLFLMLGLSQSLPEGAPTSICETLLPSHQGIRANASPSPFSLVPSTNAVRQGQSLLLQIRATPAELRFGGFMIHAIVPGRPDQVIGRFVFSAPTDAVKLIQCGELDSTATHTSPEPKASGMTIQWQAPADFTGDVVFKGTVAQDFAQFWVGIESLPVRVVREGEDLPPPVNYSPGRAPVQPMVPTFRPETKDHQQMTVIDAIYSGCGESKTCFGFPDGCVQLGNCNSVGTVTVRGDRYQFEIKSSRNNPAYVAVALSMDDQMGDDSVMECVPEQGTVKAYTSWTTGMPNYGATRDQVPQNIIKLLEGSVVDGSIYCRLEREAVSSVMGRRFDLVNDRFHLLVASGSSLKPGSVGYHDIGRIASGAPRSLAEVGDFGGKSVLLLRLHASFMLAAWIGTASAGILLARYFKQTWVGSSLCGKDQWFAWHRTFMILTWSLTIVGFVLIFVELGGWSAEQNPHAILGTVTTVLCFIQPFGALFRPAPTHRNRPIFNWLHWLVGNLAHILAIVTIFFAVKLTKAELPEWFDWILVAFVGFHVLMHIVLSLFQIAGCVSDRSQQQRINTFPMSDITPTRGSAKDRKMDAPYAGLRKGLLAIYLIIVLLFVVALIVIATLAPIEQTFDMVRTKLSN